MATVDNPLGMQMQKYGVGSATYGGGRKSPNLGPVSAAGNLGYTERDNKAKGMKAALLRRMKANQGGKFFSSAAMTPPKNLFAGPGGQ